MPETEMYFFYVFVELDSCAVQNQKAVTGYFGAVGRNWCLLSDFMNI